MRSVGVCLSVLAIVAACGHDRAPSQPLFDPVRVTVVGRPKLYALSSRPTVSRASNELFRTIAGRGDVRARASALADELRRDPRISGPTASLLSEMERDPAVRDAIAALQQQHPDAAAGRIGQLFGQQIQDVWESAPVAPAWIEAYRRLVAQLEHDAAVSALAGSLTSRLDARYGEAALVERWNQRIIELSGGSAPTRDRATQLVLDGFLDDDRLDAVAVELMGNATLRAESATALTKLLALPAIDRALHEDAAALLADPNVRSAAIELFHELATGAPDHVAVARAFDGILGSPAMVSALRDLIRIATTDPDAHALFAGWLDHVSADPAMQASLDKLLYGW